MLVDFNTAIKEIREANQDMVELINKWKDLLSTSPGDVTFEFADSSTISFPNLAKLVAQYGTFPYNELEFKEETTSGSSTTSKIARVNLSSIAVLRNYTNPGFKYIEYCALTIDDEGSPLVEISKGAQAGVTVARLYSDSLVFEDVRGSSAYNRNGVEITSPNNSMKIESNNISYSSGKESSKSDKKFSISDRGFSFKTRATSGAYPKFFKFDMDSMTLVADEWNSHVNKLPTDRSSCWSISPQELKLIAQTSNQYQHDFSVAWDPNAIDYTAKGYYWSIGPDGISLSSRTIGEPSTTFFANKDYLSLVRPFSRSQAGSGYDGIYLGKDHNGNSAPGVITIMYENSDLHETTKQALELTCGSIVYWEYDASTDNWTKAKTIL